MLDKDFVDGLVALQEADPNRTCTGCGASKPKTEFYRAWYKAQQRYRYMGRCKACHALSCRRYRTERGGSDKVNAFYRARRAADPEVSFRQSVRLLTDKAIRLGFLTPGPCEVSTADCAGRIEAHHDDYMQPFAVRWFCLTHHRQLDQHKVGRKRRAVAV